MCGSYRLITPLEALRRLFRFQQSPNLAPLPRIRPTDPVPVVRLAETGGEREIAIVRWGLLPAWVRDRDQARQLARQTFNARAETVQEKPSFRAAFAKRRCLVVADGFYEKKQLVSMADGSAFAFAGLWERWQAPDGETVETCTIITTEPNDTIRPIHHRMPVILDAAGQERWLDLSAAGGQALLKPCPDDWLVVTAAEMPTSQADGAQLSLL